MRQLVLGTRGSALALRQTDLVLQALHAALPGLEVKVRQVRTEGDRRLDLSLEQAGGQGVFVKDIEARLLSREVDLAVHSLKDMPAATPDGLTIGAVLPRADARDALVSRDGAPLAALRPGARIGSDSRRRAVQLRALRPDLEVAPIRGNVDTRIRKVEAGEYDAAALAIAGLERLGLLGKAAQVFEPDEVIPAVGQGIMAVECRTADTEVIDLLAVIDDAETRLAATAERAFLARLGAGCRLPVGAYATVEAGRLTLLAMLASEQEAVFRATDAIELGLPASRGEKLRDGRSVLDAAAELGAGVATRLARQAGIDVLRSM